MSQPRKPISAARLAANQENAAHSTGPRTSEGKTRASQNSRKHGFAAANFAVVRLEELDAVANLKADLVAVYQPVNSQELFAIERIALAQQALLRCAALESGLLATCVNETIGSLGPPPFEGTPAQVHARCLADGFIRQVHRSSSWSLFLRYQAQTERLYRRAIEEFERLRALRDELPNEPIVEPEPEETKPLTTPKTPAPASPEAPAPGPVVLHADPSRGPDHRSGPIDAASTPLPPSRPSGWYR